MFLYRKGFIALAAGLVVAFFSLTSPAQDISVFRIGTGGIAGTYYPVGGLIAQAISRPPGSRPCDQGGSCGVEGLIAVPQSSNGSVSNIKAIAEGRLESGFAQSDVVYWAYTGTGRFKGKEPVKNLRVIANLYPETLHLVTGKNAGIKTVSDLKGKRVSLDEAGSGTLVDARIVLSIYGLAEKDLIAEYMKPDVAIEKMKQGQLDAFFIVAGYPTASVRALAADGRIILVPIDEDKARKMSEKWKFFAADRIPAGTYSGIPETATVSVGAQWVVSADADEKLVYNITKAIWNTASRKILDSGHPRGKSITLDTALDGIAIPLHPGANRFYKEAGLIK